jgi:hypothetical protein
MIGKPIDSAIARKCAHIRRLVVIGHDRQHGIGAGSFGIRRQFHRLAGRIRACARDHGYPAKRCVDGCSDNAACSARFKVQASPVVPHTTNAVAPFST